MGWRKRVLAFEDSDKSLSTDPQNFPPLSSRGAKRRGDLKTMIWVLLETDLIVGVLLGLISAFVILNAVKDLIFTE